MKDKDILIELKNVSKEFINENRTVKALNDINLQLERNSFICILGSTGCGKTTLLRLMSNLEKQENGTIERFSPIEKYSFIFQESLLFPWMNILDNVTFSLDAKKIKGVKEKAVNMLKKLGLPDVEKQYPHQLSGGMRQRASIARALISDPEIMFMDEPFNAVDEKRRRNLQLQLIKLWNKENLTIVFVTHNIEEAIILGRKIIIMSPSPGKIIHKIDNPLKITTELYSKEYNDFLLHVRELFHKAN